MESIIEKAINEEIEKRLTEFKLDYKNNKETIEKQENLITSLKDKNNQLELENDNLKQSTKIEGLFLENFNKQNIGMLINTLPYKKVESVNSGMYVDELNPVFKLVFEYYNDKSEILAICDKFNIEYPKWFKDYKMPYDYDEKAVKLFIKHLGNAYVCNGCIYNENIGFFYNELRGQDGDEYKLIKHQYHDIPWQLFLRNSLLQQESIWNEILEALKSHKEHAYYFYKLDKYQTLSEDKIVQLFNLAIKDRFEEAKDFIKRHTELIHKYPKIENRYIDKIGYNWSTYHYSLFSKHIRDNYLLSLEFYELISALKDNNCNLTEVEKKEIISKSLEKNFQ